MLFPFVKMVEDHEGWMDDMRFCNLFNNISVISGQWKADSERLCAIELHLRLGGFCLERGSNSVH